MRNSKVQFIVHAAMIAAIYVVLTYFISAFNLASEPFRSGFPRR